MDVNWVVPENLNGIVDEFFFKTPCYNWFLIEYLQFKKEKILAGLTKKVVHFEYKKALEHILKTTDPPDEIYIAIVKQTMTNI